MGYSFRSRLRDVPSGGVRVIQMKDLTEENTVDPSTAIQIEGGLTPENQVAFAGDLVFRSRGLLPTAAILRECPCKAVVAAPLFRIRPDHSIVHPEYLLWFINHPQTQKFLASRLEGTVIKMIDKHVLEQLEVTLPSLERQCAIVELVAEAHREQAIMREISSKRSQLLAARLMNLAEGE